MKFKPLIEPEDRDVLTGDAEPSTDGDFNVKEDKDAAVYSTSNGWTWGPAQPTSQTDIGSKEPVIDTTPADTTDDGTDIMSITRGFCK